MSTTTSVFPDGPYAAQLVGRADDPLPSVEIGGHSGDIWLYSTTGEEARSLVAALRTAADQLEARLDEWADEVDPDPITAAAERLIATHEDVAS
jgi:hypothetical protein